MQERTYIQEIIDGTAYHICSLWNQTWNRERNESGSEGHSRVGVLSTFFRAIDTEHYLRPTKTKQLQAWLVHISLLNRSTIHWTICVWLKPLVNVWVTSYVTQTITQQSSWPFVIKLDHFAHGILVDYNLNKPILVWRYRFNIYQWTAPRLTKSFVV